MKRATRFVALNAMLFVSAGCVANRLGADRQDMRVRGALPGDVPELLASATAFVVYKINPNDQEEMPFDMPSNARGTAEEPRMCGYRVVHSIDVEDPQTKLAITRDLMKAIASQKPGAIFCFMPQHAIHAAMENGEEVDVLICYSCEEMRVYSKWGKTWSDIERVGRNRLDGLLEK